MVVIHNQFQNASEDARVQDVPAQLDFPYEGSATIHRNIGHVGLTFVPTPLGNLRDITLRGLDVLREADLVVAEDTRVARRLLSALGITGKTLWSYREQNAAGATRAILERAAGAAVAVVSDAGMPGISDPGRDLINAARAAGIGIEVLPGAVAFVTAAVLSGFDLAGLTFDGFLPRGRAARSAALRCALERSACTAFYETPRRIVESLDEISDLAPERTLFLAREISKLHEQQLVGTAESIRHALSLPVRGEIVLIVDRKSSSRAFPGEEELSAFVDEALTSNPSVREVAISVAERYGLARRDAYRFVLTRK